jgi:hypothetical protein
MKNRKYCSFKRKYNIFSKATDEKSIIIFH